MHRCRTCGKTGHNSRTCGKTPPSPVSPAPARGTSPTRPAPTIGPSAIGDAYSHIDNSFKEDGQDTLDPVVETMTAQDIETWWLLTSGKTGKQETVPANYTTPDGRRRTTRRKEAVWETSDTERLESMVRIAVEQNTSVRALKRFLKYFGAYAKTELAYTRNPLPPSRIPCIGKRPQRGSERTPRSKTGHPKASP